MSDDSALRTLLDRQQIEDTLIRYANALDDHAMDRLDQVFSEKARLDYSASGGIVGDRDELRAWLAEAMARFSGWQHLLSNIEIRIEGDSATAGTACYNPLVQSDGAVLHVGCRYHDRLHRESAGWRIVERRLELVWMDGPPALLEQLRS